MIEPGDRIDLLGDEVVERLSLALAVEDVDVDDLVLDRAAGNPTLVVDLLDRQV